MNAPIERLTGYARPNHKLSSADRIRNEEATKAMVVLLGGIAGMKVAGVGFEQLSHILQADPRDDLGGLRLVAERMVYDPSYFDTYHDEIPIDPITAKRWLIGTGRAVETSEGIAAINEDHLTLSGIAIATGENGERLSDAYRRITDNPAPFTTSLLAEMSWNIIERYADPDLPR